MIGVLWILLCWLLGNVLSDLIGGYISGSIIGMLLLFVALSLRVAKVESVRPVAKFLLSTMALFFVPYGVGLMVSYEVVVSNIWAILISAVISTLIVLLTGGHLFQLLNRKK